MQTLKECCATSHIGDLGASFERVSLAQPRDQTSTVRLPEKLKRGTIRMCMDDTEEKTNMSWEGIHVNIISSKYGFTPGSDVVLG